jgi:hypothetical protein
VRIIRLAAEVDARHVLPTIQIPTLIFHAVAIPRSTCAVRNMAERTSGAKYIELPSGDHLPWHADADVVVDEVAEFLTGVRPVHDPDRVLATVLFTDIVGATAKAASLGDRRWSEHFRSWNDQAVIVRGADGVLDRREKNRPASAAVEFGFGAKER